MQDLRLHYNFQPRFLTTLYLTPISYDDSPQSGQLHQSEYNLCVIALSLQVQINSATRWDLVLPYPQQGQRIVFFKLFQKYIPSRMSTNHLNLQYLAGGQSPQLLGRFLYELQWLLIIQAIPYRVNYSPYFPKLQIVKNLYISIYKKSQTVFFFKLFSF